MQRHIGRARAMHADHAQVIRSFRWHRPQPMHSGKCWNVQVVQKLPKLGNRARKFCPCPDQCHRSLGFFEQRNELVAERILGQSI